MILHGMSYDFVIFAADLNLGKYVLGIKFLLNCGLNHPKAISLHRLYIQKATFLGLDPRSGN